LISLDNSAERLAGLKMSQPKNISLNNYMRGSSQTPFYLAVRTSRIVPCRPVFSSAATKAILPSTPSPSIGTAKPAGSGASQRKNLAVW
jgi:hypothetical protein